MEETTRTALMNRTEDSSSVFSPAFAWNIALLLLLTAVVHVQVINDILSAEKRPQGVCVAGATAAESPTGSLRFRATQGTHAKQAAVHSKGWRGGEGDTCAFAWQVWGFHSTRTYIQNTQIYAWVLFRLHGRQT